MKKAVKKTVKLNYAIMQSAFGDYWVGKTMLKADEKSIFSKREDAVNHAQDLFCSDHPDFDMYAEEGDDNYSWEDHNAWEIIETDSLEAEEIQKRMED